ncbi:hypothetical protein HK105_209063 [Polyrhizophydium stewartii]|uniref:Ankyrin repeat protein n=1 Tax=Polyrhizophydium stewartii TaxID=2732419 RepID=A0ABR4MW12_9FUNG|nr:hypothetical protein HK105_006066 [Polyrhizophydium stewartii]
MTETPQSDEAAAPAFHWDRLPFELQDMVIGYNRLFLRRLKAGKLLTAEQRFLKRRLWQEALETDWPVDLGTLPPAPDNNDCLRLVRTRAAYEQLRLAGVAPRSTLDRIAVRNGWLDLVADSDPAQLAMIAAEEGDSVLLESVLDERKPNVKLALLAQAAAGAGQLAVMQCLHARSPPLRWLGGVLSSLTRVPGTASTAPAPADDAGWGTHIMNLAAESGNLDLVKWIHTNRPEGCTELAMDGAATNGHLAVIRWLADNRTEGCTEKALYGAAQNGHLDVLMFLHKRYRKLFTKGSAGFDKAKSLCVLVFLFPHGYIKSVRSALLNQVDTNTTAVEIQDICGALDIWPDHNFLNAAIKANNIPLTAWTLEQPLVSLRSANLSSAAGFYQLDMLVFFIEQGEEGRTAAAQGILASGSSEMVEWIEARYPGSYSQDTLEYYVRSVQPKTVSFLLKHVHSVAWDFAAALAVAGAFHVPRFQRIFDEYIATQASLLSHSGAQQ